MALKPFPWYYAVNDRPVKIVLLPNGGADCLVFDFATGDFVIDRSYFARTTETGIGKDVDQLTEEEFEHLVAWQRESAFRQRRESAICWEMDLEQGLGYKAEYRGRIYTLRINPPDRPLYTLTVDGKEVEELQEWPPAWLTPSEKRTRDAESQEDQPSIHAALLRVWAEKLCLMTSTDLRVIAEALGLDGLVSEQGGATATVQPPLEGTTKLTLYKHTLGFVFIEISVSGRRLTRAQLDAHFGEGDEIPRVHPYNAQVIAYHVEIAGAPYTCAVFASFWDEPTSKAVAHQVMLRHDRVWPAEGQSNG